LKRFRIVGGTPLKGTVTISGAKNAAVGILPAALLADGPCIVENLPQIDDVRLMAEIFKKMGVSVSQCGSSMTIDSSEVRCCKADFELSTRMRASYYLLGALLGKYGEAQIALPGGCVIGQRPIDLHIKGMNALGAQTKIEGGVLKAWAPGGLRGADIYLDFASVGATINIMLAAVRAEGMTVISNAAKEPHVVDVANFLNCMGASVKGAGTDTIRIKGKGILRGCTYAVIPDQIEAGTFMIAAAATGGDVVIRNVIPTHLEAISAKLMEMGVNVIEGDDGRELFLRISNSRGRPRGVNVKTLPYPGFPTDLQQPIMAMLTRCEGTSVIVENVFEDRFKHVPYLQRMGADININGRVAVIDGVEKLSGAPVEASDLRAGASLVIAALMAEGESIIGGVEFIDRGYEDLEGKLRALGADITRI
jgi:UDP-N-acetylglucosamine 1-carboxyvinyltransferase